MTKKQKNFSSFVLSALGFFFSFTLSAWAGVGDIYFCKTEKAFLYGIDGKVGNIEPDLFTFTMKEDAVVFQGSEILGNFILETDDGPIASENLNLYLGDEVDRFSWVKNSPNITSSALFNADILQLTLNWWDSTTSIVFASCQKL